MNGTMQDVQPASPDRSRHWSFAASVSSIISACVAAICCVGPLVFTLLGLGGAGLLGKFEPFRPHVIAVTFARLGTGFSFTYRTPAAAAATTEGGPEYACPAPGANRAGKIRPWVATVLVVGGLSFPCLPPYLFR